MNVLTPTFEPDAGLVILEGRPAGIAGEAGLALAAGTDLAFDRFDGHLVRVITGIEREPEAEPLLDRLLGDGAMKRSASGGGQHDWADRLDAHDVRAGAQRRVVQPGQAQRVPGHESGAAAVSLVDSRERDTRRTGWTARQGSRRDGLAAGRARAQRACSGLCPSAGCRRRGNGPGKGRGASAPGCTGRSILLSFRRVSSGSGCRRTPTYFVRECSGTRQLTIEATLTSGARTAGVGRCMTAAGESG